MPPISIEARRPKNFLSPWRSVYLKGRRQAAQIFHAAAFDLPPSSSHAAIVEHCNELPHLALSLSARARVAAVAVVALSARGGGGRAAAAVVGLDREEAGAVVVAHGEGGGTVVVCVGLGASGARRRAAGGVSRERSGGKGRP